MLLELRCFDGSHPAVSLRQGRGRSNHARLAVGHLVVVQLRAVGDRVGAVSVYSSTLECLLVLDSLPFGSLK